MMHSKYILGTLVLVFLIGCFEPPAFPLEPEISFNRMEFVDVEGAADSLVLTFDFQDGDGDIGLSSSDYLPPFHSFDLVFDSNGEPVFYNDTAFTLPLYSIYDSTQRELPVYEFSGELPEYSCRDYTSGYEYVINGDTIFSRQDTLLIDQNEFNKNIYLEFLRKRGADYVSINNEFSRGSCDEFFNSRIPVFDEDNMGRAISGSISFAMLSQGFKATFRNDSIKVRFYIFDRGLNKSNVAESPDFVLRDITRN
ncbi:MAG: hypothetical protein JXQ90_19900 [Cyclobacteriaceae bacterium]